MKTNNNKDLGLSPSDIYSEIKDDSNTCHYKFNGKIRRHLDSSNGLSLGPIERFVDKVINSSLPGFNAIYKAIGNQGKIAEFRNTRLSIYFKSVDSFISTVYDHDIYYIYSEYIKLFYEACNELNLHLRRFVNHLFYLDDINKYEAELFNELIELIRFKSRLPKFKHAVARRERRAAQMFESIKSYVDSLFFNHSKLLVIRLDLGYLVEVDEVTRKTKKNTTLQEAKNDLANLWRNKRHNSLFDEMVGYVWKLEYADMKGYHFHLILFFNGSNVQNDYHIADMIGRYWCEVITNNRGIYFNCNAVKTKYKHLGIGKISAESPADSELRLNLINYVVKYLTKKEQFLRIKFSKKERVIGTGEKPSRPKKPGRPRNSRRDELAALAQGLNCLI